jgi:splicing factor 45
MHRLSSSISTSAVTASSPDRQQQTGQVPSSTPSHQASGMQKSNFDDWVGDGDDDFFYQDNRARGGRKKKRKNNKPQERIWDWDDIYDPTVPNNYADYKHSEEQHREIRDWKARLYHHQLREAKRAEKSSARQSESREVDQRSKPTSTSIEMSSCASANFT